MRTQWIIVAASVLWGALLGTQTRSESPSTLDAVIEKFVLASGGRAKLDTLKSVRYTGKLTFPGGREGTFIVEAKRPDKVRIDSIMPGMTSTEAYDGTTGWRTVPGRPDAQRMPPEQARSLANRIHLESPLIDYNKKGSKVELAGTEDVEGAAAHKIKLTEKQGGVFYFFIDTTEHLPLKLTWSEKIQGTEVAFEHSFGDYRKVDGITLYHWVQGREGGQVEFTAEVSKVELNPNIADDRFTMPKGKP